jgi:hypothetical protein
MSWRHQVGVAFSQFLSESAFSLECKTQGAQPPQVTPDQHPVWMHPIPALKPNGMAIGLDLPAKRGLHPKNSFTLAKFEALLACKTRMSRSPRGNGQNRI